MSGGRTACAVTVLALGLVLNLAPAGAAVSRSSGAPKTPTNLRITSTTATSISLAWDASGSNSSNWWYCVQRSGAGCIRVDPPRTSITISRLWPGTTFVYSVYTIDIRGNRSGNSNTVTYTTPADTTPPSAPTLSTTAVFPTRVSLSWTQSMDNATQVYYTLFVDGSPFPEGQIGFRDATVLDLAPSSTHTFTVSARDAFGNTTESNTVTVTTPPATNGQPPTAPTNLRLSPESSVPEIWLEWDPSTDDVDLQSQIKYEIFLNGELADVAIGYTNTIVYCRGEGTNTITVRAVDTSENASGFSNEIVFC
jgi:hypothetical protein